MKGAAPDRAQLPLPSAPRIDGDGLHAEDCECARCALGFRPTRAERWNAHMAREIREKAQRAAELKAAEVAKEDVKRAVTWRRLEVQERDTAEMLKAMTKPVERPATAEELDELKKQYGFRPRRRRP